MQAWVANYGGAALFLLLMFGIVGLPVPDETLLVFCGYLIWKGTLSMTGTWAGAAAGSICGITCSYLIGRTAGIRVIHSRLGRILHLSDARMHRIHDWFDRIGHWALLIGYYVPGVRHFTAIVAGTSGLEYHSFAAYAYTGAAIWVSTFLFIGYWFGENWEQVLHSIHRHLTIAAVVAGVLITGYVLWRVWQKRARRRAARGA